MSAHYCAALQTRCTEATVLTRRTINSGIKSALYLLGVTGWARRTARADGIVRVLAYHSVAESPDYCSLSINVEPGIFEQQMRYLARHYNVITLDDIVACANGDAPLPERAVVLTFDDGYRNNLQIAAPILHKYGLVAHFFVISDVVLGKTSFWVSGVQRLLSRAEGNGKFASAFELNVEPNGTSYRQHVIDAFMAVVNQRDGGPGSSLIDDAYRFFGRDAEEEIHTDYMLTNDDVVRLDRMGMKIGSHSVDHPILTRLPHLRQRFQLEHSKNSLQSILQKPVEHVAFPNGPGVVNCDESTADLAHDTGYLTASTSVRGVVRDTTRAHFIPRQNVDSAEGIMPFAFKLEEHKFLSIQRP